MSQYAITISPAEASKEFDVLLRGPGIDPTGRRYVFANTHRCVAFAEAVNFAYDQGLRDGLRRRENEKGRLLIVTGATPDALEARPEGLWSRFRRYWR
jgi:hypothetical protein